MPEIASYRHGTARLFPGADPPSGPAAEGEGFYVTVRRSPGTPAEKVGLLLGPYPTYERADGEVPAGRRLAEAADPFAAFDVFGVTKYRAKKGRGLPAGKLTARRDAELEADAAALVDAVLGELVPCDHADGQLAVLASLLRVTESEPAGVTP